MKIKSKLVVADTDPLVREHRVFDIHILPGVSMLDVIYKTLVSAHIAMDQVKINDIVFHEPVVTHETMDRRLTVNIEFDDSVGIVKITSVPCYHGQDQSDVNTLHLTANLIRVAGLMLEPLDSIELTAAQDLDQCYQVTRKIGIYHEAFMKCLGEVCRLPGGDILGHARLGSAAAKCSEQFLLHPVFLDCSTIVPLFYLGERLDSASLYIPFAIQGFQGTPMTGHKEVLIRVRQPDQTVEGKEILSHSFDIYALDGTPMASFDSFSVKKVHDLGNVRQLLNSGQSARVKPASAAAIPTHGMASSSASVAAVTSGQAVAPVVAPVVDNKVANNDDDPLNNWIINHLTSIDSLEWRADMIDTPFFDMGLDSLALLDISEKISQQLKVELYPTVMFEHSTVSGFALYLKDAFADELEAALAVADTTAVAAPVSVVKAAQHGDPGTLATAREPEVSVMTTRWLAVEPAAVCQSNNAAVPGDIIAIWSAHSDDRPQPLATALGQKLASGAGQLNQADLSNSTVLNRFNDLWLINPDHNDLFSLIKTLIDSGHIDNLAHIRVFTSNAFSLHGGPVDLTAAHGVWGMLQSLSREYSHLRVSQTDICEQEFSQLTAAGQSLWLDPLIALDSSQPRRLLAYRQGHFYRRSLLSCDNFDDRSPNIRYQGVYVVIGGATGVGLAFVNYLRQHYDARVAIIGRRDESLLGTLHDEADGYGDSVIYHRCAVEDSAGLKQALDSIKNHFGQLHGIVHSAMVLDDKPLVQMSANSLKKVMTPKSAGIRALAAATASQSLDFLLIFSSVQSFVGNTSQANYASASSYIDGYANALATQRDYPVTVVNWGFWQDTGAVANDVHRQLLARQGMYGLTAAQAFASLMHSMAGGWQQVAIMVANEAVLKEMGWQPKHRLQGPATAIAAIKAAEAIEVTDDGPIELADTRKFQQHFIDVQTGMDQLIPLARQVIAGVLNHLAIFDRNSLIKELQQKVVVPEHLRLLETLLEKVQQPLALGQFLSPRAFVRQAAVLQQQYPAIERFLPLLSACLSGLEAALKGSLSPFDIVFEDGDAELVSQVYGKSEVSLYYNRILAQAVIRKARLLQRQQRALGHNRAIRILEIGAGTGASCHQISKILAQGKFEFEYCYTDLWDKLVNEAKARFADSPFNMQFKILDIGTDPVLQGFVESFDVIVATNVLHATPSLATTLRHIKKLLLPQGTLLINESVEAQEFSTYTFGLLPGWWNSADAQNRLDGAPLASEQNWRRLLLDCGFEQLQNRVPDIAAFSSQVVLEAKSDGVIWSSGKKGQAKSLPTALAAQLVAVTPQQLGATGLAEPKCLKLYLDHNNNIWLFLDNPPANTFTLALLTELCDILAAIKPVIDNKILYISHLGNYFSLGGDRPQLLEFLANRQTEELTLFARQAKQLLAAMVELPALVVTVVNGSAQGGGLETLLAADMQVVAKNVKVGLPEIKSGLIPGMGGLTYLSRQIGIARTKKLILGGELITADEAAAAGIITHAVDDPFAVALALDATINNRRTAVHIKQRLAAEQKTLLTADIEHWLDYMLNQGEWIDSDRVNKAKLLIDAQAHS